jgi:hypothetical protein
MSVSVVLGALVSSSLRSVAWARVEICGKGRGMELEVGKGLMLMMLI